MDVVGVLRFAVGVVLLVGGAELLVRGASRLAAAASISPLVIGLTVVAYGTSAPELAVSLGAAYAGTDQLALGNVVGSNVFNVLLILGISAIITPMVVDQQVVRREVPLLIGLSIAVLLFGWDGRIDRVEGLLLGAGAVAYTVWTIRQSRRESKAIESEYEAEFGTREVESVRFPIEILRVISGLVLLVIGARWLVEESIRFARYLGVEEIVIGLTVVAAGTSLPEVATSVVAAIRGERDIAVGNVIGSNIFNILAVLGFSAALGPGGISVPESALAFDVPVMIAVAVACLPIFLSDYRIDRWEGFVFFGYYVAYTAYLVLDAMGHAVLGTYVRAMVFFVMPLTALTLLVVLVRGIQQQRGASRREA